MSLSSDQKSDLALALILLRDYKTVPYCLDLVVFVQIVELAKYLGIYKELEKLLTELPPFEIKIRNK